MTHTITEIAQQLKDSDKKVQLIYGFNGSGKTRLSREFANLVSVSTGRDQEIEKNSMKLLYYNAFTEDLFYWDNSQKANAKPKLKVHPNGFTDWILKDQGQGSNIVDTFQRYTTKKITPMFNEEYQIEGADGIKVKVPENSEVTFRLNQIESTTKDGSPNAKGEYEHVKVSRGEESNFIWSVFLALIDEVVSVTNESDSDSSNFDQLRYLEYIFVDDPVSSLDENHIIELAVDLASLIKYSSSRLKFIITTHNPLFYNILCNEVNKKVCFFLSRNENGTFDLTEQKSNTNQGFSYHLHLKKILENAITEQKVEKYHFTLLRNLYEKTASFLGYNNWSNLLDTASGDKEAYLRSIMNYSSHRNLSGEEVREPTEQEKQTVRLLLENLKKYGYFSESTEND